MKEFIYRKEDYIHPTDLKAFDDLIENYNYNLNAVRNDKEFEIILTFLLSLTERAVNFIPAYEQINCLIDADDNNLKILKTAVEKKWFEASLRIADKEKLFSRKLSWNWNENRALIRGIYLGATLYWSKGEFEYANDLFTKLFNTNIEDNIGARFAMKATQEKMSYDEFNLRFIFEDVYGTHYRRELEKWYEG